MFHHENVEINACMLQILIRSYTSKMGYLETNDSLKVNYVIFYVEESSLYRPFQPL